MAGAHALPPILVYSLTFEYTWALTLESSWQALMLFHRLLRETPAREKLYDKTQNYLPCLLFSPFYCPCFLFLFCAGETTSRKLTCLASFFFLSYFLDVCLCGCGGGCGCGCGCGCGFRFAPSQVHGRQHLRKHPGFHSGIVCLCLCLCVYTHMYVELVDTSESLQASTLRLCECALSVGMRGSVLCCV